MRWKFGIESQMGGKTGTTNDNTDGWFMGYTPQLLAGAWVGCDDPFLHLSNGWTGGGNDMAMPEFAYFLQKVYTDKELGIDPKAEFEKPTQLNNDPIYADQNFSSIVQHGEGTDLDNQQGNGNASDYFDAPVDVPVESEFEKVKEKKSLPTEYDKPIGPSMYPPAKKDTSKPKKVEPKKDEATDPKKNIPKAVMPKKTSDFK